MSFGNRSLPSSDEERINLAASVLALSSCQYSAEQLQDCVTRNGLDPENERVVQNKCGLQLKNVESCLSSVPHESIILTLAGIAKDACPRQTIALQTCVDSNNKNPEKCQKEMVASLACAANAVLTTIDEELQSQNRNSAW